MTINLQNGTDHPVKRCHKTPLSIAVSMALALPTLTQAATFNVTEALDDGTGLVANTLSWAILQANTTPGDDLIELNTNVTITAVMKRLIDSNTTLQSDATRRTIDGNSQFRPLFIKSGQVTIQNLDIENGLAKGGDSSIGGRGAGMGGAVFVYDGDITLNNLHIENSTAIGGSDVASYIRGGGGMFGYGRRGGGGLFADTSLGTNYDGAYGGYGNYLNNDSNFARGGDSTGYSSNGVVGAGGFGGGGGMGYIDDGGNGGFGAGGGNGYYTNGGDGGFGAGGGGAEYKTPGQPGYGGTYNLAAGFGGALFIRTGNITLEDIRFSNNRAMQTTSPNGSSAGLGGAIFVLHTSQNSNGNNQGMPTELADVTGCGFELINNIADTDPSTIDNNDTFFDLANRMTPANNFSFTDSCGPADPEIQITGRSSFEIVDGDMQPDVIDGTDLGQAIVDFIPVSQSFTINNTGNSFLQLTGDPVVSLINNNNNQFSVTFLPESIIGTSQFDNFEITFAPTMTGTDTATVVIENNDADENPYEFVVQAEGVMGTADILLLGNGQEIVNNDDTPNLIDFTDFGSTVLNNPIVQSFTIQNNGNANLTLSGTPSVELLNNSGQFSISSQPSETLLNPADTTTFDVTFLASNKGVDSTTVVIVNDDPDENPYEFVIQAEAIEIPPEISIEGNGNVIQDGDMTPETSDFTSMGQAQESAQSITRTYTILNEGPGELILSGMPIVELQNNNGQFSVSTQPSSNSLITNEQLNFDITFTPNNIGIDSATVVIQNNDPDEAPYDFVIEAEGIAQQGVLQVLGNGIEIQNEDQTPDAADDTWFGYTPVTGGQVDHFFVLKNNGFADLNLTNVVLNQVGNHFSIINNINDTDLSPGESTFVEVRFDPEFPSFNVFTALEVYGDNNQLIHFHLIQGFGQSTLTINAENNYFQEGETPTFTVDRDVFTPYDTEVIWTVNGQVDAADFGGALPSGTVNIPPTADSATFAFSTVMDGTYEGPEFFNVRLSTTDPRLNLGFPSVSGGVIDDDLIYVDGFDELSLNQVINSISKFAPDLQQLPVCDSYACLFLNRSMAIEMDTINRGINALNWFEETLALMQPAGDWDGDGLPNSHDLNPFGIESVLLKNIYLLQ